MTFVTNSHLRVYKNSNESEFAKITYELQNDDLPGIEPGTQMLVKTESTNVFDDDISRDKNFIRRYPLLHGIKKWKFSYWRKDKDQTINSWDNEKEDMRNRYPDKILISFDCFGPSKVSFEGRYTFRTEMPLNGLNPSF
jgi:hypothetical protein